MAVEYVLVAQLVIAVVAAYFTPSVIALCRGLPRPEMVLAVNALAGWTVIGWLLALSMALRRQLPSQPAPGAAPFPCCVCVLRGACADLEPGPQLPSGHSLN